MCALQWWLLFRFVFLGDVRAWPRLKAMSRLRVRRDLKQLKETVERAERLGLDPAPIIEHFCHERLRILEAYARRGAL